MRFDALLATLILTTVVFVCILMAVISVFAEDPFGGDIDPVHKEVISNWLEGNPDWRPAGEDDDFGDTSGDRLGKDYVPYYLAHDLNRDGADDFAVIVIGKQDKSKRGVLVFTGPFGNGAPAKPAFFSDILKDGDLLFLSSPAEVGSDRVLIGSFASGNFQALEYVRGSFGLVSMGDGVTCYG